MAQVVMLVFPSRGKMVDAIDALQNLEYVKINNSALLAKAADGEVTILEDDINPEEGAIAGGTLGSLMGALGVASLGAFLLPGVGPILAIGAGAIIGGLLGGATGSITARLVDLGFRNDQLDDLTRRLENDHVAVVLELESRENLVERLRTDLASTEADVVLPAA